MILLIDNYDSFVYNLAQILGTLDNKLVVARNDEISLNEIALMKPAYIFISPGPKRPSEAGISMDVIRYFAGRIPILGVCLGHQAIGEVFGARVVRAPDIVHGKTTMIYHTKDGIYQELRNPFSAMRYHSLIVDRTDLPSCLKITSWTKDGLIMGLRHKDHPIEGVQFHPESILTEFGRKIIKNFLQYYKKE